MLHNMSGLNVRKTKNETVQKTLKMEALKKSVLIVFCFKGKTPQDTALTIAVTKKHISLKWHKPKLFLDLCM